jgi:hypothetical protein
MKKKAGGHHETEKPGIFLKEPGGDGADGWRALFLLLH